MVLVEQWRHAVGARVLEVAAGKYDVDGEAVEDALRRELAEELGVEGGTLTFMASFYTTPGWSDEVLDLYLAEGATPIEGGAPETDWEEQGIEVVRLPFEEGSGGRRPPRGRQDPGRPRPVRPHAGRVVGARPGRPAPAGRAGPPGGQPPA